jgi:hypothetical protein
LEFASEELRRDRDIVMAAVQQDGSALEFASEELRRDSVIANLHSMITIQQHPQVSSEN